MNKNKLLCLYKQELKDRRNIMAEIAGWNNCSHNLDELFLKAQKLCREAQQKYSTKE